MTHPFWPSDTPSDVNPFWPQATPDSLGEIIGADDVRDALRATILEWAPYYLGVLSARLAAANRIGGIDADGNTQPPNPLPNFGMWLDEPEYRSLGTGEPAAFLVTVPATVGAPELKADRSYIATWRAQVRIQVFGTVWEQARDLVSWYEKAVRWAVLQHRSLGGFAMATKWAGHSFTEDEHDSTRTVMSAYLGLDVTVDDVTDVARGPVTVPATFEPPPPNETTETVTMAFTKVPVTEEV